MSKQPLYPHVPGGKKVELYIGGTVEEYDARGMALSEVQKVESKYPAHLFRQMSAMYPWETTMDDMERFKRRAIKEGAVIAIIQEYGMTAYLPIGETFGERHSRNLNEFERREGI